MTVMPTGEDEGGGAAKASDLEPAPEPLLSPTPATRQARSGWRAAFWFAVLLAVVIAGIAAAPFWAPAVTPLLPWGRGSAAPAAGRAALEARLAALEERPAIAAADLAQLRSEEAGLAQRLDRLDATAAQQGAAAAALPQMQQGLGRLDKLAIRLADRIDGLQAKIDAVEAKLRARADAGGNQAVLLLSLMELREAVDAGRPFTAEYQGFAALAQSRPDLEAVAAPLAQGAGSGIATPAALRQELSALADRVAAPVPPTRQEWWQQALSRMRGLVTVRRVGVPRSGRETAVETAQTALGAGDLAGAVAAVGALSGSDAEAAAPWLEKARARLVAETALARLQVRLVAPLGAAPAAGAKAVPEAAPAAVPPAKAGAPS